MVVRTKKYASSHISWRTGNKTGRFNKESAQVFGSNPGKPFLEYQLEFLRRRGIEDIVMCIGHMGEQIERYFGDGRKYGMNIKYSHEDKPLGTAGALKKAEALLRNKR